MNILQLPSGREYQAIRIVHVTRVKFTQYSMWTKLASTTVFGVHIQRPYTVWYGSKYRTLRITKQKVICELALHFSMSNLFSATQNRPPHDDK